MAADGRMCRRSRRMRASSKRTSAGRDDLMKARGGIRGLVKSGDDNGQSADRGICTHADPAGSVGHVVKPGAADSEVKPSSTDLAEEAWIYVRGCRIKRASLRFNSQGEVYVPDSEDDESGIEVATDGGAELAPAVAADEDADVDLVPAVAADGATGVEMNPEVAARLAKKVLGEDLHPKVAALLAEVLSKMEPFYHECFIGMYKLILVINSF